MKRAILKSFLALAFLVFCSSSIQAQDKVETVEVKITGMMCGGCASKVYKVLQDTNGVIDNEVKYPGDVAIVKYNPDETTADDIVGVINEETDFSAELKEES